MKLSEKFVLFLTKHKDLFQEKTVNYFIENINHIELYEATDELVVYLNKCDYFIEDMLFQPSTEDDCTFFIRDKYVPMKEHESIIILSNGGGKTTYNPQMQERSEKGKERVKSVVNYNTKTDNYEKSLHNEVSSIRPELRYPSSIQKFNRERGLHPTQKPLELIEYLIKTYTNEGELVLDNTFGSNTTGLGCKNLNRKYIGIEMDEKYFEIGINRISAKIKLKK